MREQIELVLARLRLGGRDIKTSWPRFSACHWHPGTERRGIYQDGRLRGGQRETIFYFRAPPAPQAAGAGTRACSGPRLVPLLVLPRGRNRLARPCHAEPTIWTGGQAHGAGRRRAGGTAVSVCPGSGLSALVACLLLVTGNCKGTCCEGKGREEDRVETGRAQDPGCQVEASGQAVRGNRG